MATDLQRAQAISDALYNATASLPQVNRIGSAMAAMVGKRAAYDAADTNGKAAIYVSAFRGVVINAIKDSETRDAAQAAAQAKAAALTQEFGQ